MGLSHLARRAAEVAAGGEPSPADDRWVGSILKPHELRLWSEQAGYDRRHAVAVARRVEAELGDDPRWLRAALLHDVGKVRAGLGLVGRSTVTAVQALFPVRAAAWEEAASTAHARDVIMDPVKGRPAAGVYLAHGPIGAAWLARHGTEEEVATWVRVHHRQDLWPETPLPTDVLRALAAADQD